MYACDTDDNGTPSIEGELQVYFDRFVEEGGERGITVDYNTIAVSGEFTILLGPNILGSCSDRDASFSRIRINRPYWDNASELEREFLIFHELGHCYLKREHLETEFTDRICVSIMASGTGPCRQNYTEATRSTYIDELFGIWLV